MARDDVSPQGQPVDSPEVVARVSSCLPLVSTLARGMRRQLGPSVSVDDLESAGHEALLRAARSFDETKGVPFARWAALRLRGAMIDCVRSQGALPRSMYKRIRAMEALDRVEALHKEETPRATSPEDADAKLSDFLGQAATAMALAFLGQKPLDEARDVAAPSESPFDAAARAELRELLLRGIAERSDNERHLLMRHYFDDLNFDEAAKEIGLSKSWASRVHARALDGLAKYVKRHQRV
jgi:RNA polymerase sigma factor for flagellar operon FliA